jgi:hypothetical protein
MSSSESQVVSDTNNKNKHNKSESYGGKKKSCSENLFLRGCVSSHGDHQTLHLRQPWLPILTCAVLLSFPIITTTIKIVISLPQDQMESLQGSPLLQEVEGVALNILLSQIH